MTGETSRVGSSADTAPMGYGVLNAVAAVLILAGIVGQIAVIGAYRRGELQAIEAVALFALALALTGGWLWYFYSRYVVQAARAARSAKIAALHPDAPWLLNEAWAARRVVDRSSRREVIFLWIWVAAWWAACALIAPRSPSWWHTLFWLIALSVGLFGIVAASGRTLRWWRYGASTLHVDTLPAYLGGRFRGTVRTDITDVPKLVAEVTCEKLTVTWTPTPKGGRRKDITAEPLWSYAWPVERAQRSGNKTGPTVIPIDVALPDGQPQVEIDDEGGGVQWMLYLDADDGAGGDTATSRARRAARLSGFAAEFPIPVYARR